MIVYSVRWQSQFSFPRTTVTRPFVRLQDRAVWSEPPTGRSGHCRDARNGGAIGARQCASTGSIGGITDGPRVRAPIVCISDEVEWLRAVLRLRPESR